MPVGLLYDGLEANLARSGREVVDQALPRRSLHRGPSHRGLASATLVTELRRSRRERRSRCPTGIAQVVPKGRTISTERIAGRAGNGEGEYCDKESNTVSMRPTASLPRSAPRSFRISAQRCSRSSHREATAHDDRFLVIEQRKAVTSSISIPERRAWSCLTTPMATQRFAGSWTRRMS